MTEEITTQVWLLATLFGGAGAAIVQIIIDPVKNAIQKNRLKRHLRRELNFNINRVSQTIEKLKELKEEHIKLDRTDTFYHYFKFKHSSVIFRNLINTGVIYEYLDDDQMLKFDNFATSYSDTDADILNQDIMKIRNSEYSKTESANKTDFYIHKFNEMKIITYLFILC